LLDQVHAHHWSDTTPAAEYSDIVGGVHVYDSVVVLDRRRTPAPFAELAGTWDFLKNSRPLAALQSELVATRDVALAGAAASARDLARAAAERDMAIEQVQTMSRSSSWRLTRPLRALRRALGR
jgi:hypothetical protein